MPVPVPNYSKGLGRSLANLKIGVPANHYFDIVDEEVETAVRKAIASLEEMGAQIVEVRLDTLEYVDLLRPVMATDSFIVHEPFLADHRHEYPPGQLHRILAGQFILARDYSKAMRVQRLIMEDFANVLQRVDMLATPTVPIPALLRSGESITVAGVTYPVSAPGMSFTNRVLGLSIRNVFPSNHTGLPSLSVPCGLTGAGLPIGLQLIARPFEEPLLYGVASRYEEVSPSKGKLPTIT